MRFLRAVAVVCLLLVFGWGSALIAVFLYGRRDEARPADAIVVLGAAQYAGHPSPVLRARLDHAIELYRRHLAHTLIFTGGVGLGDTISEAEVGRAYALKRGVAPGDILMERSGVSTDQSMGRVKRILDAQHLTTVILVSDPFHMLRLRLLAARLGIHAYSSPTRTSPIALNSREEWKYVFRESLILPFALFRRL